MDAYIGEIRIWPIRKCPVNWHFCDGTQLSISEFQPLYALLGVTYGGDGVTKFALPNLSGRLPIHCGQGTNLSVRKIGQAFGTDTVSLTPSQMPMHDHLFMASSAQATSQSPENAVLGNTTTPDVLLYLNEAAAGTKVVMDSGMLEATGGGQSHNNTMPTLALEFIICLQGNFPTNPN